MAVTAASSCSGPRGPRGHLSAQLTVNVVELGAVDPLVNLPACRGSSAARQHCLMERQQGIRSRSSSCSSSRSISRAAGGARQASTAHAVLFCQNMLQCCLTPQLSQHLRGAAGGQAEISQSLVIHMSMRACHFDAQPKQTQPNSSRVGRAVSLESTGQPRTMPANRTRPCRGSTPRSDLRSTASFTVMKPGSEPSGCCSVVRSWVPIFHCSAGQQGGKGSGKVGHAAQGRQPV